MNGANSITPSSATSNALTSSVMIATSGRASPVTCEPTWLIVSADQSFRKSGCRQRPPLGQSVRMISSLRRALARPSSEGTYEGRVIGFDVHPHALVETCRPARVLGVDTEPDAGRTARTQLTKRVEEQRLATPRRLHGLRTPTQFTRPPPRRPDSACTSAAISSRHARGTRGSGRHPPAGATTGRMCRGRSPIRPRRSRSKPRTTRRRHPRGTDGTSSHRVAVTRRCLTKLDRHRVVASRFAIAA